jgi:hypothetical protein
VVSTAGTLSTRSRGGKPGSWNLITIDERTVSIDLMEWGTEAREFRRARMNTYPRPQG